MPSSRAWPPSALEFIAHSRKSWTVWPLLWSFRGSTCTASAPGHTSTRRCCTFPRRVRPWRRSTVHACLPAGIFCPLRSCKPCCCRQSSPLLRHLHPKMDRKIRTLQAFLSPEPPPRIWASAVRLWFRCLFIFATAFGGMNLALCREVMQFTRDSEIGIADTAFDFVDALDNARVTRFGPTHDFGGLRPTLVLAGFRRWRTTPLLLREAYSRSLSSCHRFLLDILPSFGSVLTCSRKVLKMCVVPEWSRRTTGVIRSSSSDATSHFSLSLPAPPSATWFASKLLPRLDRAGIDALHRRIVKHEAAEFYFLPLFSTSLSALQPFGR